MKKIITLLLLSAIVATAAQAQCWQRMAAGSFHSVAIKADGTLWACGWNLYGELGDGTTVGKTSPVQIASTADWKSVATGNFHTLAIKTDGTLWAWGNNEFGQLGDGTNTDKTSPVQIGTATDWKSIAGGGSYTLAIKTDGTLWAWGRNGFGQLGDGTTDDKNIPTKIGTATDWQSVVAGDSHSLAIKTDGTLWAWGDNGQYGLLGNGGLSSQIEKPQQIGTATNWQSVAAGRDHTLAIKTDGTLWAWGNNFYGQLGDGTDVTKIIPTQIGTATNWKSVAGGQDHSIALKTDGTGWAWGNNFYGQLGDDTNIKKNIPTQIGTATDWQSMAAGANHGLAIKTDGSLSAWGLNNKGELGDGTIVNKNAPTGLDCAGIGDGCAAAHDINGLFGGALGVAKTSGLYDNTNASSLNDPTTGIGCFFGGDGLARTIWYSFTGDGKKFSIRTVKCNATNYITDGGGSPGDTQMAIYTGTCGSLDPVLCAEDENDAVGLYNAYTEILTTAGTKYSMLIDGWGNAKGEYCVEVTNLAFVGVTDIAQTEIRLFPNPTTGLVRLENVQAERVEVFDQTGRLVRSVERPGGSVDISSVAAGVFFLKIYEEGKVFSARVVKE